jgi:hypothetical protein
MNGKRIEVEREMLKQLVSKIYLIAVDLTLYQIDMKHMKKL